MNLLLAYFALVFLILLLSGLVVISFWRYRFQGDRTALVISLYFVAFILVMGSTLFLLNPGALSNDSGVSTTLEGF